MVQHGEALTRESGDASLAEAVVSGDEEKLGNRLRAILAYARKLTLTPAQITEGDLDRLREHGLDDRAIVDGNQVISYYNYVNRVADGLGVQLEPDWPPEKRRPRRYRCPEMDFPSVAASSIPGLTVAPMREVDRLTIEEFACSQGRAGTGAAASQPPGTCSSPAPRSLSPWPLRRTGWHP